MQNVPESDEARNWHEAEWQNEEEHWSDQTDRSGIAETVMFEEMLDSRDFLTRALEIGTSERDFGSLKTACVEILVDMTALVSGCASLSVGDKCFSKARVIYVYTPLMAASRMTDAILDSEGGACVWSLNIYICIYCTGLLCSVV